ncbi:MAG: nucleoside 2-deoxyribosyltransferase [Spirochaetes bacterium]|nr:nucleoside 2-deoxyribosyltransferase [Spirochaetota bacterium]
MNGTGKRIYLAGPEVFLSDPYEAGRRKCELCGRYGFIGVYPLDNPLALDGLPPREQGKLISAANEASLRTCHLVIANMTPFRGPSADAGTAYEMGFARALGLPVFAYSNCAEPFTARTAASACGGRDVSGVLRDNAGMLIEQFDMTDNLMLDGGVLAGGGTVIIRDIAEAMRFTDLSAFEECLSRMKEKYL